MTLIDIINEVTSALNGDTDIDPCQLKELIQTLILADDERESLIRLVDSATNLIWGDVY
jgi:hypothetical protein